MSIIKHLFALMLLIGYVYVNYALGKWLIAITSWDFMMECDVPPMCSIMILSSVTLMGCIGYI
jgi:hypothetical protein